MKKFVLSFLVLIMFIGIVYSADNPRLPRDLDNGVVVESLDYVGVNYKLISETVSQTAVTTVPSIAYGIVFSTGAKSFDYVILYDSTTTSTAGEMFTILCDTTTSVQGASIPRIITLPQPVQTTKGIYAKNSAATFKTTILYRKLR